MMKLVFATNNAHKLQEVRQILGDSIHLTTLAECGITEDIPETSATIEGNALQKARYVWSKTHLDCFADDTGLEVDALDGAPGVHSARYATDGHDFDANVRLLLHNLSGITNRSARFRTVIALIIDGNEYTFEGIVNGRIIDDCKGVGGFGYDPVFIPEGHTETFSQMSADAKNAISHRGRAVAALSAWLTLHHPTQQ